MFSYFSKKRAGWLLLKLINQAHIASTDMFPHEGLLQVGGSCLFAKSQLIVKVHQLVREIYKVSSRCGWELHFQQQFKKLWMIADDFISLIDNSSQQEADSANQAARCFYLICGGTWKLVKPADSKLCPPYESSIEPWDKLLKCSGVSELWVEADIGKTIELLHAQQSRLSCDMKGRMDCSSQSSSTPCNTHR